MGEYQKVVSIDLWREIADRMGVDFELREFLQVIGLLILLWLIAGVAVT
jgi:hypothetical protein